MTYFYITIAYGKEKMLCKLIPDVESPWNAKNNSGKSHINSQAL